ncbi:Autophagy-related protein 16 [Nymphaea thermarum]|nr:Autophagy-related protein 16 [Nymphaea thermarum]
MDDVGVAAIKHALRALKQRHLLEEAAHGPAFIAISRPLTSPATVWKEKLESLEQELQQCYKAQSRLSEQLVTEVAECRTLKAQVQEKDEAMSALQEELKKEREESSRLKIILEERSKALDLVIGENQALRERLDDAIQKAKKVESENKMLIDRWMAEKMQHAEQLNEVAQASGLFARSIVLRLSILISLFKLVQANALYEDLSNRLRASSLEQLALQQVDGVVRQSEAVSADFVSSAIPSTCKRKIPAHKGSCSSVMFENNSNKLVSGGQEQTVKFWDVNTGNSCGSLSGCLGSVLDMAVSHDNKTVIAASSSNNLYVWDVGSGRIRHTLTGHTDKVCAVDIGKLSNRLLVSAAYDRTIKTWDLQKGYCLNTIMSHSNCNALCFSADGQTICSGHVDGNLRMWDTRTGKLMSEVAAHSQIVTSISLSRSGNIVLTCGRDNLHNLFDVRTLEVCGTFRANGVKIASNWSRSCISSDDNYVAAGSSDGAVYVWSRLSPDTVSRLVEHTAPVLACTWSGLGTPLASADKSGTICIWT